MSGQGQGLRNKVGWIVVVGEKEESSRITVGTIYQMFATRQGS